jgi:hypothetical protein
MLGLEKMAFLLGAFSVIEVLDVSRRRRHDRWGSWGIESLGGVLSVSN